MKNKNNESLIKIETFASPSVYQLERLKCNTPYCFNGFVEIYKWRITVEKIEEPIEVITERLEALFRNTTNYHDYDPLIKASEKINYKFTGQFGQNALKNKE